jgi:hypothetical protein
MTFSLKKGAVESESLSAFLPEILPEKEAVESISVERFPSWNFPWKSELLNRKVLSGSLPEYLWKKGAVESESAKPFFWKIGYFILEKFSDISKSCYQTYKFGDVYWCH